MSTLFQLCPDDTYLGLRNLAIIGLLCDTGVRSEEVANLLLKNVDVEARVLRVYSDKTEEWRYLPLTDEAVALLQNYLNGVSGTSPELPGIEWLTIKTSADMSVALCGLASCFCHGREPP